MPGLDPGIHSAKDSIMRNGLDCRVKPGNDDSSESDL